MVRALLGWGLMNARDTILLAGSIGLLALGILSAIRGGRSPLAWPLALLSFDLFGWNFATLGNHLFHALLWRVFDVSLSALTPPLVFHVILAFVGRLRKERLFLAGTYLLFGALSLSSACALFAEWARAWIESTAWAVLFLAGWLPTLARQLFLLVRHLRQSADALEQARTRTMLAALAVGAALASTELWNDVGLHFPGLGALGILISTALVAVVALRFRLFDGRLETTTVATVAALVTAALFAYLGIFTLLGGNFAALAFGTGTLTLLLLATTREIVMSLSTYRERRERLAVLGRFSAQMAHDLKNPLAALMGAAEVLQGAKGPEEQKEFSLLMIEQVSRIRVIVEKYERIGRVEPVCTTLRMNEIVEGVARARRAGAKDGVELDLTLEPLLPECEADTDLIAGALENLVRNAIEAMPEGGTLRIRTRSDAARAALLVEVQDSGEGMDARQAERAFDDFYTTKATGSGLGLAFVRRVALAHGGEASLVSEKGKGTTVTLRFPTAG